jgi:hypothetical protein
MNQKLFQIVIAVPYFSFSLSYLIQEVPFCYSPLIDVNVFRFPQCGMYYAFPLPELNALF